MLKKKAIEMVKKAQSKGSKVLSGHEAVELCRLYGINVIPSVEVSLNPGLPVELFAHKVIQTVKQNYGENDWPLVAKISSNDEEVGGHKSDLGGVKLNLKNEKELEAAVVQIYNNLFKKHNIAKEKVQGLQIQPFVSGHELQEIFVGTKIDPGSKRGTLTLGEGGLLVDLHQGTQKAMMLPEEGEDAIYKATKLLETSPIQGYFNEQKPIRKELTIGNKDEMIEQVARISQMAVDLKEFVTDININPFKICYDGSIKSVDAKVVLKSQ